MNKKWDPSPFDWIEIPRETALKYGILVCDCGHTEKEHFRGDVSSPCSHSSCKCKHYKEVVNL